MGTAKPVNNRGVVHASVPVRVEFCAAAGVLQHDGFAAVSCQSSRHVELREAFILLHSRGYANQTQRLYARLLAELTQVPNQTLYDDFQRTMMLVDTGRTQTNNLIWVYHWTVSNELEKRSEQTLLRALKLAEEQK